MVPPKASVGRPVLIRELADSVEGAPSAGIDLSGREYFVGAVPAFLDASEPVYLRESSSYPGIGFCFDCMGVQLSPIHVPS